MLNILCCVQQEHLLLHRNDQIQYVFDPTIATASQKKKKKAIRSRSTKVTILLLDPSKGIPKKNYHRQLRENGIIEVKQNISSVEIKMSFAELLVQ